MKEFGSEKIIFDKMTAVLFPYMAFVYALISSAFMGQSIPTTAFDEAIWYCVDTM